MNKHQRRIQHSNKLRLFKFKSRSHRLLVTLFILAAFALVAYYVSSPPPSQAQLTPSADLVISQIYGGGGNTNATYEDDFIEIYNRGATSVTFTNWSLQYNGATAGGTWSVLPISGTIGAGNYFLVRITTSGTTSSVAFPASDASGSLGGTGGIGAVSGKVALVINTTPLTGTCPQGDAQTSSIRDFVGYGRGAAGDAPNCFEGAGFALGPATSPTSVTNTTSVIRKSVVGATTGTTGCQDTNNNSADFTTVSPPTPRNSATTAAPCGVGEFSIAFDSAAQGCAFNPTIGLPAGGTFTWNHTIGTGDSRALYVGVSTSLETLPVGVGTVPPRVSVTYNGVAMTAIGSQVSGEGALPDTRAAVEMFRLTQAQLPAAGTYPVVVTFLQPVNYAVGGSVSFNGVNQTTPNRAFVGNSGDTTVTPANTPQINVASASNEVVLDTVAQSFAAGALVVGPGQTERWNGLPCFGGLNSIGAGSTEPGATTTNMSWTQGNTGTWAIGAVSIIPLAPTEVEVASFDATQTSAGTVLSWKTGYEVNNLGFNIYRERNGKRTRVNPSPIAGSALLAGQGTRLTAGQSYSWLDRSSKNKDVQYWLEDIDLSGARKLHGPIVPAASDSLDASTKEQAMLLSQLSLMSSADTDSVKGYPAAQLQKTEQPQIMEARETQAQATQLTTKRRLAAKVLLLNNELLDVVTPENAPAGRQPVSIYVDDQPIRQRALAAAPAVKIAIRQPGWYRLTASDLLAAGINPNVDPTSLQLYADGVEQAIIWNGEKKELDAHSSMEFYATGMDTPTSDTRTYWLVAGSKPGKRISVEDGQKPDYTLWLDRDVSRIEAPATESAPKPQPNNKPAAPDNPATINPAPSATVNAIVPGVVLILPRSDDAATTATSSDAPKAKKKASKKKTARKLLRGRQHHASRKQALLNTSAQGFAYTVERKERSVYFAALLNGEADNFFGPVITGTPVNQAMKVSGIEPSSSSNATLEVSLQGGTVQAHQVRVEFNGTEVGVMSFTDQERTRQSFQIPRAWLTEGDNTVTLTSMGGDSDVNVLDYLRLTYQRAYRAENDKLTFTSDHNAPFNVDGFTNPNIRVFDITDQDEVRELSIKVSQKGSAYAVKIPGGRGTTRTLMALTEGQAQTPAGITANEPSGLSGSENRADFVILTHKGFREAVKPLADLRRSQGLEVAVVNIEDVYDEFSYGAHSRTAVRDFFLWAKTKWQRAPAYALLVGDASLDPRNYLGRGYQDYIPTRMVDTRLFETASDDALVDFNADGIADISIGRLPVQTFEQAQKVVGKITGYTPGQSGTGALLVSDHLEGYDFEAANNSIRELLPSDMAVTTVNRRDRSAEEVRADILAGINQGPQIVNYAGHGSVEVWTGAGILRSSDKTSLTNGNKLPFVLTMTCLNGFFQDVFSESLAEALLKADGGGAVAVWASSGLTQPDRQALMDQQFIRLMFATSAQSPTLGDAVRGAKEATADMDIRRTWILFGDPTMRIR